MNRFMLVAASIIVLLASGPLTMHAEDLRQYRIRGDFVTIVVTWLATTATFARIDGS